MAADIVLKKKEAKTITLTVVDADGDALAIDGATLTLSIKRLFTDTADLITKNDADFDKTNAATGIVTFQLSASDTDRTGLYYADLKMYWSATNILKSGNITIEISRAVTD